MQIIEEETYIRAEIGETFDAARNMDIHAQTVWRITREKVVTGSRMPWIQLGDDVTFRATHLGIRQNLTVKVIEFDRPHSFVEEMKKGAFRYLKHSHYFFRQDEGTVMRDVLEFASPFGFAGKLFDFLVLRHYMKRFLTDRNRRFKAYLEGEHN